MSTNLIPDSLRILDSAAFTGSYQEIGSPLSFAANVIKIYNGANQPVQISIDGSTDHLYVDQLREFSIESTASNPISAGTQFFANGFPGEGNEGIIYLMAFYSSP
ncbi:MAG: hypothetical protein Q8L68_01510 [Methylococcales bacterium]|nr:hypothetical protein [Methylococcales bacterium]